MFNYKHLFYNQEFLNQVSYILGISGCSPDPVSQGNHAINMTQMTLQSLILNQVDKLQHWFLEKTCSASQKSR